MIPFRACFLAKPDLTLQDKLKAELPGILHRLITLAPTVISNGLQPPAAVLDETEELFDELDVAKQFADDCLDFDLAARTTNEEMQAAVTRWLHLGITIGNTGVEELLRDLKQSPGVTYKRVRANAPGKSGRSAPSRYVYAGVKLRKQEL